MEGIKYVDIFATKGIEYIVAIIFLVMLIFFWRWLNKPVAGALASKNKSETRLSLVDWFRMADNYYYHQGHSWVRRENDNTVLIGIDDFAQKLLGKPSNLNLPSVGSKLQQGETGLQLNVDGKSVDFLSPVDGEVVAVNDMAIKSPGIINQDPYKSGWLLKIKSDKLNTNLKNLLSGEVARAWIQDTVNKLSMRISNNYGVVLQDGGTITNGFVKELAPDNWQEVVKEYFLTDEN
jgi:glycine cleavage system H lipoate-binding protein